MVVNKCSYDKESGIAPPQRSACGQNPAVRAAAWAPKSADPPRHVQSQEAEQEKPKKPRQHKEEQPTTKHKHRGNA
jgi:hypothetical protein